MTKQLNEAISELSEGFAAFRDNHQNELAELRAEVERLERIQARPDGGGTKDLRPAPGYGVLHVSENQKAYVLDNKTRLSDVPELKTEPPISLDRWCNALIFGNACEDKQAVEFLAEQKSVGTGSTGVLIPEGFVTEWIDMARSQSVLVRAGMRTVTMPEQTLTYSHQTADPTFSWRSSEGASLSASDPTFASRVLTAKTIAVRTQVSLEATQDIPSFGAQISRAYTAAFGAAIDQAGIRGSGSAPTGLHDTSGVTKVTSVGTPTNYDDLLDGVAAFLNANNSLEQLSGVIWHPDVWKTFAKLKTGISSDNTPLEMPMALRDVPKFATTNADVPSSPEDYHITMGNFDDLVMGVRMNPTIRILDGTTSMASNLLVEIVGVARVDFLATRPASFVVLEDVTTS